MNLGEVLKRITSRKCIESIDKSELLEPIRADTLFLVKITDNLLELTCSQMLLFLDVIIHFGNGTKCLAQILAIKSVQCALKNTHCRRQVDNLNQLRFAQEPLVIFLCSGQSLSQTQLIIIVFFETYG